MENTINDELMQRGIFLLTGDIDITTVRPAIEWLLYETQVQAEPKKELTFIISSEGGSVPDAFSLIDMMKGSHIPIRTIGTGIIASAALLIFITGDAATRTLTPNTSIMSHQFSWANEGKAHELFAVAKEVELTQHRMINHYANSIGQPLEIIREKLLPPHDVWLSADEALQFGICSKVTNILF
jgi:ATP-dependent Clp protease, protease subunit